MNAIKFDEIKMQIWGFRILRIGLALVFLWFGSQQLMDPSGWTRLVPDFVESVMSKEKFIIANGLFDLIGGILLLLNFWVRWIAVLLTVHLLSIAFNFGFSGNGVRDFGLAMACLALSFLSPGKSIQ